VATFPYVGFLDGTPYPVIPRGARTVNVSTSSQLTTAINNAAPGDRIVLASGTYSGSFTVSGKNGSSSAGISIEAGTIGGPKFASGSTITVNNSAYVTILGLAFPYELGSGNLVQFRGSSHHCRVTRCLFGPASIGSPGSSKAPFVYCGNDTKHIRIDHNEFRNKANPGNTILADGNFDTFQAVQFIRIDHNYFHDIKPEVDNEKEPIRIGVSTMSKTMSWSVIERNVFEACICEPEIVSAKAGGIRITGNSFLRSIGGPVYRHGIDGVMSDNYVVDKETNVPEPPEQTLGVGGVATPGNAILTTSDSTSSLTISTSGTASSPRVYDGQGHTVGRINVEADHVVVQNFRIRAHSQYGAYLDGNNITFQNNDIKDVEPTGDGDLNAITAFGNNIKIKYNTAINFVTVDPGDSHTDFIQTWVSDSHPVASANWEIIGNKAVGPHNPDRESSVPSIHQWLMAEGFERGGNSGGDGGDPNNWLVADNEIGDSWNQAIKLDGVDNVHVTRNRFVGSSTKVMDVTSASSNVRYYSDNVVSGDYESIGVSITSGSGPTSL
jgi:pectate lyase